jgi:hypothetical protein
MAEGFRQSPSAMTKNILIILHSETSTAGRIGQMLAARLPAGHPPAVPWR